MKSRHDRYLLGTIGPALLAFLPAGHARPVLAGPSCKALSETILKGMVTPESEVKTVGDTCVFTHIRVKTGTLQAWSVAQLTVQGLADWDEKTSPLPPHIRAEAKGILFAPEIESSHVRYQMAVNAKPFDARLDFGFDMAARRIELREVALESPWLGHVSLGFSLQFPGDDTPSPAGMFDAWVSHVHLVLDNKYLFESMLMPAIISAVPEDKDPAIEFPKLQVKGAHAIEALPDTVADRDSRDALVRFVQDFPHPGGHFEFDLSLAHPQSLESLIKGKMDAPLDGAKIVARYVTSAEGSP